MRLTPAQIGLLELLGELVPMIPERTLAERIESGRKCLMEVSGEDFGFDPARWHEYLKESDAGAYRWSNKHLGIPKRVAQALGDAEWCEAIKKLQENLGR